MDNTALNTTGSIINKDETYWINMVSLINETAARYYTILASVDRYFASSRNALRRQWSSTKIAIRFIIGNIFFWCL
ncbi:unnamed protein product, partial [Rotaria sordida]